MSESLRTRIRTRLWIWTAPAISVLAALALISTAARAADVDLKAAASNYSSSCASCHGQSGKGDGSAGATLAVATALNGAIREGNLATALLPAHCNWMCNRAMPGFNPERNIFTEPEPPYLPLGIIHVAASVKTGVWPVLDQTGKTHMKVLTYPLLPM